MPKLVLNERDKEARVPAGLLVARTFIAPVGAVAHPRAVAPSGAAVPLPAVPPPPGTVIVGVDHIEGATIRVEADGTFPSGSVVTVVLEVATYAVEIGPLSVGGLSMQDIAELSLEDGQVVVRVVAGDGERIELSPVGEAARAATADLLDSARVSGDARATVRVLLDGSASFRTLSETIVRQAVDVLSGVIAIIGDYRVGVAVSGPVVRTATIDGLTGLSAEVSALLSSSPRAVGARLSEPELFRSASHGPTRTWVLTDDVPAGLASLATAAAAASTALNIIVVGHASMTPPPEVDGVSFTFFDADALESSTASPGALALPEIVDALLRHSTSAGFDRKVSS